MVSPGKIVKVKSCTYEMWKTDCFECKKFNKSHRIKNKKKIIANVSLKIDKYFRLKKLKICCKKYLSFRLAIVGVILLEMLTILF